MIESYGISDVGCVRSENQDRILTDHSLMLFVVADGMGGHQHGERAAELAISTIRYRMSSSIDELDATWPYGYNFDWSFHGNRINTAIRMAHGQVLKSSRESEEHAGMGTTVAALLIAGGSAIIANVGDSRVYRMRGGELSQLTVDDSWVASLSAGGALTEEETMNHPMRNALTQAAGAQEQIDVHIHEHSLLPEDVFLLTSDGMHGTTSLRAMESIIGSGDDPQRISERLIEEARSRGAPDNVSAIVVRYAT